jgi:hypothetical protein
MHLELPPAIDRLRLPVVTTASKHAAQAENETELGRFIAECCEQTPNRPTRFSEFFAHFQQWLPDAEKHIWTRKQVAAQLPVRHKTVPGNDHVTFVPHLTLKPAGGAKP